jgi:hypothetical protein
LGGGVERLDELRRNLRDDCIAVTAQSSHAGGYPISHRESAGFNRPPLSIPAEEPVSITPEAVSRAGEGFCDSHATRPSSAFNGTAWHSGPSFQSRLVAVGQPASWASNTRQAQPCFVPWIAFCPADLPDVSCACGVVHPASWA